MTFKEFEINKYLSLRLEEDITNIYVNGNLFRQCTLLILNIPIDEFEYFDEVESIDEAAEKLGWSEDTQEKFVTYKGYSLSPEEEFFGHCSNLQVWYEHRYDTRLLHHSLSFWLLRELSFYDPVAKSVFKEELAKRYGSGCESVVNFLAEEFEIDSYLTHEDFLYIELVPEEAEVLLDVESLLDDNYGFIRTSRFDSPRQFITKNKHIISLLIGEGANLDKFPHIMEKLCNLKYLEYLFVGSNKLENVPVSITNLENLIYLDLSGNAFTHMPPILKAMKSLQFVNLSENKLPDHVDYTIFNSIFFNNTFFPASYLPPISFKNVLHHMYRVLEIIKSCNLLYLTKFVNSYYNPELTPLEEIFKRLLQYHKTKIEKNGPELVYNNGIVSLK